MLRGSDLARLMITLGIASLLYEVANRATPITGGVDGLQGVEISKVFGVFGFDLYGRTGFVYTFAIVLLLFCVARAWINSPVGLSLRAIRDNPVRARAIGVPLHRRLVTVYVVSAAIAGVAGALLTQTTQFVGIDVLSFQRSANLLIMLIVGGHGDAVRRLRRRGAVHPRAGPARRHQPGVLAVLARRAADRDDAVPAARRRRQRIDGADRSDADARPKATRDA